jgi:hypothetical protein
VLDLVRHTEAVYRHKTETIRGDYRNESAPRVPVSEDAGVETFVSALDEVTEAFESSDLTRPSWTWCPHEHRADWWTRRMAHETLIHAADAIVASGAEPGAERWLALDGVDEVLEEMIIDAPSWASVTPTNERIDLVSDDQTWSLRFARLQGTSPDTGETRDAETVILDDTGEPGLVIATDPATLVLWLWGRAPLPPGDQQGHRDAAARLRSIAAAAT